MQRFTQYTLRSQLTAAADTAMSREAEKCSASWRSFSASDACCRTRHESLRGQSSTCQPAPSSQRLQTHAGRQVGKWKDTYTHTHTDTAIQIAQQLAPTDRQAGSWTRHVHTHTHTHI